MAKHLVVIGGGAAGFFCAINAAQMNTALRVTVLEKTGKLLSKVKVSGGGRCNITHSCMDITEMASRYPRGQHFVKKTFHQFFTNHTIEWFEKRGVKVRAEPDGRMFPVTNSSQTVIECLLKEAGRYNVSIRMNAEATGIKPEGGKFIIRLNNEEDMTSDFICIASGGYPKEGMFNWIAAAGHTIEKPVPSLFTFNLPDHAITGLMGVTAGQVRIKIPGTKLEEEGPLLITHWGFSGPSVLRLSAWGARELAERDYNFQCSINWVPGYNENTLREKLQQYRHSNASQRIKGKNHFTLPARLWEFLLQQSGITEETRWADLSSVSLNKLVKTLCSYECMVKGKTTFKEEFVTAGGIKLNEVDVNTMMSKKIPGLFFAGEVLDVDGITGGYNFQHAWTSGWIAAKSIAARAEQQ